MEEADACPRPPPNNPFEEVRGVYAVMVDGSRNGTSSELAIISPPLKKL